ncbi:hypothetical protein [Vibrio metoecus]|uniref:hypothetical protein n=1 Tax=Vibrio metoecus TaxID=1481663 RepID=UPI00215CBB2C|nr:hypothetical protein [Vibrio metoecus]MCR9387634.1 hypothetical protein [Vibrio metoecus]
MFQTAASLLSFILLCAASLLHHADTPFSSAPHFDNQIQHQTHHTVAKLAMLPTRLQGHRLLLSCEPEEKEESPLSSLPNATDDSIRLALSQSIHTDNVALLNRTTLTYARKAWLFTNLYSRYAHA